MSAKETILARIREALQVAAPPPGIHETPGPNHPARGPEPDTFQHWLPPVGDTFTARRDLFAKNADLLKAVFKSVANAEAATAEIRQIASREQWKNIATHRNPLVEAACGPVGLPLLYTDGGYDLAQLEAGAGGVTACESLIAQTGSVLITSRSCGGRALSVLPPHHVVLATPDQLLPDLSDAFAHLRRKYDGDYPSAISFITGPSRTGDIERILVLGAHGPKQLTILLVG